jgi:MHS family proline/betaine transporter-like MFS transporter
MIGNILEWYDFSIYGFFAVQIGAAFFHAEDPVSRILATFGVFAVGFLMRPLGAIVIGYIGDRTGRSTALTISMVGMAVATLGMGLLPGYASIGVAAPILLTLLRMIQGLAVGGEAAIANVFMVENAPRGRRALAGALCGAGDGIGIHAAALVALVCASLLSPAELQQWGWRIPFWLSLVLATTGLFIRRSLRELPRPALAPDRSLLADVLRNHLPLVLRIAGMCVFAAVGMQIAFIYIIGWLQTVDRLPAQAALRITFFSMLAITPVGLFFGWLADHIGRRNILLLGAALGMVGSVPFFMLMEHPSPALILLGQAGFVLALSMQFGVNGALAVEITPEEIRCTVLAVGHNIAWSIVGGLTPLVAAWLTWRTGDERSPAYLVAAAAAITFVTVLSIVDGFRNELRPRAVTT